MLPSGGCMDLAKSGGRIAQISSDHRWPDHTHGGSQSGGLLTGDDMGITMVYHWFTYHEQPGTLGRPALRGIAGGLSPLTDIPMTWAWFTDLLSSLCGERPWSCPHEHSLPDLQYAAGIYSIHVSRPRVTSTYVMYRPKRKPT